MEDTIVVESGALREGSEVRRAMECVELPLFFFALRNFGTGLSQITS